MKINRFKYFYPEKPTLISIDQPLMDEICMQPEWIAEKKYNEIRLILHYINGEFQYWNRHGERLSYEPTKEVENILYNLPLKEYCVFDGGLRHNKVVGIKNKIVLYDVLIWNGELLLDKNFKERRLILEDFLEVEGDPIGIPKQYQTPKEYLKDVFKRVITKPEFEGLVIKNLNGMLNLGRNSASNSKWMLKVRRPSGRYRF